MRKLVLVIGIFLLAAICLGVWEYLASAVKTPMAHGAPRRIVSLSPGITESLYAIGLGDRVTGVTRFCNWPPEAATRPKVAGFRELNLEAIARTSPDLVVMPDDMAHFKRLVENLGIPVFLFEGRTLSGFLRDVDRLGATCGVADKARRLTDAFRSAIAQIPDKGGSAPPTALFALMNADECARPITELRVLGSGDFYSELLKTAGIKNAYGGNAAYPWLSREAMLALKPDLLIVSAPDCADLPALARQLRDPAMPLAPHVLILDDPGDTIPGPRSLETLNKLAGAAREASPGMETR